MTELIVRIADLCEAEGRVLRAMTVRVALAVAFILVAAAAVAGGAGLLLGALYVSVAEQAGTATALGTTGAVALAIGRLLAWLGHRMGT